MDELFTTFMGKDFFAYRYTEEKSCVVVEEDHPLLQYDDALWEKIGQIKMMERQLVENETPRTRKARRGSIPKKSRRKLFKIRKRKKNSLSSSVVSSSSSGNTSTKTKGKLQPSSSGFTNKSQKSCVQNTRRCLFEMSKRKRKQRTPLATSSPKRKTSLCSTPMRMTPLSSDTSRPPSLSPLDVSPLSAESSLLSSSASATTPPPSVVSGQPSFSASAATSSSTDSASSASTLQTSHASALPPFDHVFSPSCTREKILSCKLPPVDCSLTVQGVLVSVPQNYIFTDVATLKNRPPARVVNDAVSLIREVRKEDHDKAFIDLDVDDVGVSIGQAGVFSRSGLGQLEWLAEVAEMQYNSKEEKTWLMQTPDNLDNETRDKILNLLLKFPLNYLVAKEGKYSVNVRAFTKLALERYIDDTVIDTAIARLQRQFNVNESFLCLPAHTITWLNTGDSDFIRQCFEEILENVKPGVLSMVLIPVNMGEVHWGLMVVDVKNKEAYFDDGLGWSFSKPSYLHLIINELHLKFPDCSDFSLNAWQNVKAFKRFGMPRQPTDGQVVGSGSCGLGVILSALDFMNHVKPHRASRSWSFNEMTVHRKDIMKLLSSA